MRCRPFFRLVVVSFSLAPCSLAQKIASVFPLGAPRGSSATLEIRGQDFDGAYAVWFEAKGIAGQIKKIEPVEADNTEGGDGQKQPKKWFRALVDLKIDPSAGVGRHMVRLVSPRGMSAGHPFVVTADPVVLESRSAHADPEHAQPLEVPTLLAGKLWEKGEVDFYSFDASPGVEIAFRAVSNQATPVNGGGFDAMQFTVYEPGGTWFDPHRPIRLASSSLPRLSYKFSKRGRHFLEVGAFSGISGPDVVYLLLIVPKRTGVLAETRLLADVPELQESGLEPIREAFSRRLERSRVDALSARTVAVSNLEKRNAMNPTLASAAGSSAVAQGGSLKQSPGQQPQSIVTPSDSVAAVELSGPLLLEGVIDRPNKADSYKLRLKSGQHLAFELETPEATVPEFNPMVKLLDHDGQEVFNNVWFRVGPVVESRLKSLQSKILYNFERDGEYTLQVRDLTPRFGNASFKYRVLIRPQVPHIGKIAVKEEIINVRPGKAEKLTLTVAEEEGYSGAVAVAVENLPPGVQALTSTEVPPDPEPLLDKGKMEQFVAKNERVEILVAAGMDAPPSTLPRIARLVARAVVEGVVGPPVWSQDMPVMVVNPKTTEQSAK
jgi:hypothetical protein